MKICARTRDIETWFDTGNESDELRRHLADCAVCQEHLKFLEATRGAMKKTAASLAQRSVDVDRFLSDFRERAKTAPHGFRPRWALISAAAAACLVALSLLSILTPRDHSVDARSYVDSARTEIEGATAQTYHADDGTAVVWVNVPEGDMW